MATVTRIRANWTGTPGGTQQTAFHFRGTLAGADLTAAANKVRAFFDGFKGDLSNTWQIGIESNAAVFDDGGAKQDEPTIPSLPAILNGTATGQKVAAGAGACITWRTGKYSGGRPVLGRTFVVPLVVAAYDVDGSLNPGLVTALNATATALRSGTGPELVVWQRKKSLLPDLVRVNTVTGHSVSDRVAFLGNRR